MVQRAITCLAIATCCFLNTWVELAEGQLPYHLRSHPWQTSVSAVLVLQTALASLLFAAWHLASRRPKIPVAFHLAFALYCIWPLGISAAALIRLVPYDFTTLVRQKWFWPAALAVQVPGLIAGLVYIRRFTRLLRALFFYSWPPLLLLVLLAARTTLLSHSPAEYADAPLAPPIAGTSPLTRIVWIVFDELSETATFERRPRDLALPNFDQLRNASFVATRAHSPADFTIRAMPSLILGQTVIDTNPAGPRSLSLLIEGRNGRQGWEKVQNVFDRARELKVNSAVAGWYHPYSRVLNRSLVQSAWAPPSLLPGLEEQFTTTALPARMYYRMRLQLAALPLAGRFEALSANRYHVDEKKQRYAYLIEQSRRFAADPSIGLVLLHLSVPHPPSIEEDGKLGYRGGLLTADRALAQVREAIANAGLSERTVLIVTSDHGWRADLWRNGAVWTRHDADFMADADPTRVPFVVHFPGQTRQLTFDKRLNTVDTGHLLLDILRGEISRPDQLPAWFDRTLR